VVITAQGDGHVTVDLRDFYHRQLHLVGVDSLQTHAIQSARILTELRAGFESGYLTPPNVTAVPLREAVAAYKRLSESAQSRVSAPKMVLIGPE